MTFIKIALGIIKICRNWPQLIANRLLTKLGLGKFAPSIESINLKSGVRFTTGERKTLGPSDLFVINEVWARHNYLASNNNDFKINLEDTVIDIGANKGYFSIFAAKLALKGKVIAFEPAPANYELLSANIKLNNLANVKPEPLAVSSEKKPTQLYLSEENEGGHSLVSEHGHRVGVYATDLDSYCNDHNIEWIDFLKIDCEGEEYAIIDSFSISMFNKINKISMEHHPVEGRSAIEIVDKLKQNGFKILEFDQSYIKAIKA